MKPIHQLNFRLIVVHVTATLFFVLAAKRFSLFYDLELAEVLMKYDGNGNNDILLNTAGTGMGQRMTEQFYAGFFSVIVALLISFVISLIFCLKRNVFWGNALIVFILGFIFYRSGLLDLDIINTLCNAIGNLFHSYGLAYVLLINGFILTVIGILIYFNKWSRKYIQNRNALN